MRELQATFDIITNGLRMQDGRSVDISNNCMYRGLNGHKCAAGYVIPDEKYDAVFEGCSLVTPNLNMGSQMQEKAQKLYNIIVVEGEHNLELVKALQQVHDFQKVSSWELFFQKIAKRFELKYTCPVELQYNHNTLNNYGKQVDGGVATPVC